MQAGLLVVVSGPAGVGKGTVLKRVIENNKDIDFSISATSRSPRPGELDGVNYFYKTREQFEEMIKNDMLVEWVEYCGNYYGTPKEYILDQIEQERTVILEIEVEGALNVKKVFPDAVLIFVLPPSYDELKRRITKRGTESEDVIEKRMNRALEEIEISKNYNYIIVNDR